MDWVGAISTGATTLAAGTTAVGYIVLPSTVKLEFTDPTLTRIRGVFNFVPTADPSGDIFGAVGIIEWPDINDTSPVAGEQPLPADFPDMDWIWWYPIIIIGQATAMGRENTRVEIDSRAQRRLGNRMGVLIVVQNLPGSGGSFDYMHGSRSLLKDG